MRKIGIVFLLVYCLVLDACMLYPGTRGKRTNRGNETPADAIELNAVRVTPKRNDEFRFAAPKLIDIIHTDLEVSFNWGKHECIGKETLLLKPYFYETDSIILDAQNMNFTDIKIVDANQQNIDYLTSYDKKQLKLKLDHKISTQDSIKLILRYVAHPDEIDGTGGRAIRDDKGLYFINTDNSEPKVPVQIWTQGEVESNSAWFPTVDKPNEKFTMKLAITVNKDMTTLSNGVLTSSLINGVQKTDIWQSKKPIPAYLVMMAIGNFQVTKDELATIETETYQDVRYDTLRISLNDSLGTTRDSVVAHYSTKTRQVKKDLLNGVEVSYYLEPSYSPYALNIFKHTPEMIDFYSAKLGVNYPWEKYAQVVVHDYVSGAMENASAALHNEFVQKNNRELVDGDNDDIIAHELFHQWFGDLVTCKSWSHLVLNEGFATYGEQLWSEYKYGRDAASEQALNSLRRYIDYSNDRNDDPIVQFNYKSPDDMFNTITYQKGALVLNLLRSVLGDEAFFLALKNYLTNYGYANAEVDDFRRECEIVSGRDLHQFFNQWFFKGGHPIIDIRYDYNDSTKLMAVTVEQKQSRETGIFKFPLKFKVSQAGITKFFNFDIEKRIETFYVKKFDPESGEIPNVFVDPDVTFIGEIKDNKPFIQHIKSYTYGTSYVERIRSLRELNSIQNTIDTARVIILSAIHDPNEEIRIKAIEWTIWANPKNLFARNELVELAKTDPSAKVRAKATLALSNLKDATQFNSLLQLTSDSSYSVAANALWGIYKIQPEEALRLCSSLERDAKRDLFSKISSVYAAVGTPNDISFFEKNMMQVSSRARRPLIDDYVEFSTRLNTDSIYQRIIGTLTDRSYNDKKGFIRAASVGGLNTIYQKLKAELLQEKDLAKRTEKQQTNQALSESIQRIVDQEVDEETINLFKMKGLTQTAEIKQDR